MVDNTSHFLLTHNYIESKGLILFYHLCFHLKMIKNMFLPFPILIIKSVYVSLSYCGWRSEKVGSELLALIGKYSNVSAFKIVFVINSQYILCYLSFI